MTTSVENKGKRYLLLTAIIVALAITFINDMVAFAPLMFVAGVTFSWSYWYWWRSIIWKKQLKVQEEELYKSWVERYEQERVVQDGNRI